VITASHEIRAHLAKAGIGSFVIPTTSLLPSRPLEEIDGAPSGPVKVFTVGRIYPRKNYELFKKIGTAAHRSFGSRIQFSAKLDYAPLPETEYIRKLDTSDIYLVTSYQEGGPLPAMDAMLRGEIVLSTPVGQMPELIEDGYNGFICRTLDEFIARLDQLVKNPSLLRTMRRNALQRLQVARSREVIVEAVQKALVG
jgi:glycosyltransferase involved in cell wall biosynthesis